ncbi:MAG: hypothetical protein OXF42_00430 [Candidatus Dadabacteria bacterium]|nr:hypothetical protein [Candidatus Dadabacteria bacterium]
MRNTKSHTHEVWASLILCDRDQKRIKKFLVSDFGLKEKSVVKEMHLTVYHSRRLFRGVYPLSESASVELDVGDTRFMVMISGGENPRVGVKPGDKRIGIRVQKRSKTRNIVDQYRSCLTALESQDILGKRKRSTRSHNAFGAKSFQPHMTLLLPGSGIGQDLREIGIAFRKTLGLLVFDRFSVEVSKIR